ncbi:MAG: AAA family ATPase [Lachnospiraceae bacterium]|nr:AAA family ATPase [Lachnospiraceae bacterium]
MATFFSWRWKYRKYVDDTVWAMLCLGLEDIYGRVSGIDPGKLWRDGREFELDPWLSPENFFMGFLEACVMKDLICGTMEEFSEDLQNGSMDKEEVLAELATIFKTDYFKDKTITAKEVMDTFPGEKEKAFLLKAIRTIYHYKPQSGEIQKDADIEEMCKWFHKVRNYFFVKTESDKAFGDELRKCFLSAKEGGRMITACDVLFFCLDFLKVKEKEEVKRLDFAALSEYFVHLQKGITEKVICQDTAVRKFIQGLFNGRLRKEDELSGPEGTFLFVGPPGVGKTYLAQTAAELSGRPHKVFMMSEYAHDSDFHGLVGFESTWKDSKEGDLTSFVSEHENAVLIFDEIEKAHLNTIHQFLSILEGGYARDLYTQQDVDFTHTTVIFTTNAGRKFYEENRDMAISAIPEATILDALRNDMRKDKTPVMPPEILSRMSKGNIIGFDHMNPAKLVPIIKTGMEKAAQIVEAAMDMECDYDTSLLPYLFLYHMGGNLDARVAAARSENFIKESVFRVSERVGEDSKEFKKAAKNKEKIRIHFEVEENELAEELTKPDRASNLIVVCNTADRAKFKAKNNEYKCYYVYAEKEDNDYKEYISSQVRDHKIDAILVDPFMREKKSEQALEGLSNKNTTGNQVIDWLMEQNAFPPVYCIELNKQHISFVDRQDLQQRGVKGILPLSDAENAKEREEMIRDLCYELFLAGKLERLNSRGRALEFETGHRIESSEKAAEITIRLHNFSLVRSMDTEARELFFEVGAENRDSFDSVVGGETAKEELIRFVKFIKDPELYRRSGQQISKGILMYGPPGSGKTKLARALASEADCPFISATGTQFIRGEKSLTDVFRVARKYAPSIVFIDEIESFAMDSRVGTQYPEILKQLLTEMDGFDKSGRPVFVIAATNAAKAPNLGERNIFLDEALLRRFTKRVYMKWPDRKERIAFLEMKKEEQKHRQYNFNLLSQEDIRDFADLTAGYSLSEIQNVLELAIGRAAERDEKITIDLLTTCFEEFVYGEEHNYAKEQIRNTAIHEAGHAFMGFYCDGETGGRFVPEYATIISRGGFLGMVRQKNDESRTGYSKRELLKLIRIKLAGRAAEIVFANEAEEGLTTGASNDLESATDIAAEIVSRFGMEEGFLAVLPMEMMMNSSLAPQYYAKLNSIMQRELDATIAIIRENRSKVEALADALLDRSRLDTEEMRKIIG